jgi:hypothetical protein
VSDGRAVEKSMRELTVMRQKLVADPEAGELLCQLSEKMSGAFAETPHKTVPVKNGFRQLSADDGAT